MKRKIVLLLIAIFMLSVFVGTVEFVVPKAEAQTQYYGITPTTATVTASALNVRQGPSTASRIVCVLYKNQTAVVFGKIGNWYLIYVPAKNCVGVAYSTYLRIGAAPAPKPPTTPTPKPPTTPTPKPPTTPTPPSTPEGITAEEQEMLNYVNQARANAGVKALQFDMELVKIARLKAQDMVNKNYFSHTSPTYGSPFDMMRQFGISYRTAGENIAGNRTAKAAFDAWMNLSGHRQNILNPNYNYTGIGIASGSKYGKIYVQMFIGR